MKKKKEDEELVLDSQLPQLKDYDKLLLPRQTDSPKRMCSKSVLTSIRTMSSVCNC